MQQDERVQAPPYSTVFKIWKILQYYNILEIALFNIL